MQNPGNLESEMVGLDGAVVRCTGVWRNRGSGDGYTCLPKG